MSKWQVAFNVWVHVLLTLAILTLTLCTFYPHLHDEAVRVSLLALIFLHVMKS